MKIYRIKTDSNNVAILTTDDPLYDKIQSKNRFRGTSLKKTWEKMSLYRYNPQKKPLDFWQLINDVLIFNEEIKNVINPVIDTYGEYLDIEVENGPELYLFNVTTAMECINIDQSMYEVFPDVPKPGAKLRRMFGKDCLLVKEIKNEKCYFWQPVFDADKITSNIFFVIDHRGFGHGPYCTSGFFGPEEEFYHVYHDNNLTGLLFEEVELSK